MLDIHVVSHTHWDREWYLTHEQFRFRLVALVDRLLDLLDADPSYKHFHLDGQTIVLPLVAPGLGATAIFNLAAYWSEFSLALVLLDSQERFTMPLGLFSFQSAYETDWQLLAAASFIALVPVLAAFVLLQRFFVAGLTAGAVKG